jgi:uncharacterized damage-inducible protein DinB
MTLSEGLLPEFDQEMANTRKALERVPDGKLGWKPHEKSGTMGWLATHIALIPHWVEVIVRQTQFDIAPPGSPPYVPPATGSVKEILELFDKHIAAARATIAGASDEELLKPWSLLSGGKPILTMPRIAALRGVIMNHLIHHRGQLTVYLRLNNVPVPGLYGPSADEKTM